MPRAWLTPNSPAPESERCRTISVPDDLELVGAVTGALLPLTQADNWEAHGTMTPEEAAGIMSAAFDLFVNSECQGDCPPPTAPGTDYPIFRRNPSSGATEQWDGEQWIEPTGDYAIPDRVARTEETEGEQLCAGAVSAAGVIKALYIAMLDFYEEEVDPYLNYAEFALQTGILIGSSFGNISTAYAALLEFAVSNFVAAMDELTVAMWSDSWHQKLICILKEHETSVAGVISFNWSAVMADLVGLIIPILDENLLVRWQTWYIIQFLGPEALNAAGEKTGYAGDCVDCGLWCHTFDFTESPHDWTTFILGTFITTAGTWVSGTGWVGTIGVDSSGARGTNIVIRIAGAGSINRISVVYDRSNGQHTSTIPASQLALDWDGSTWTVKQQVNSLGAAGTDLTQTWEGTDTDFTSNVVVRFSASVRSGATPSPIGTVTIKSVTLSGIGLNPFGDNNCE